MFSTAKKFIERNGRASVKSARLIGMVLGAWFKLKFMLPEDNKREYMRNFFTRARDLFGIAVEFNANGAPVEKNKLAWFVSNHSSSLDWLMMDAVINPEGEAPKNTYILAGEFLTWPVIGELIRGSNIIGSRRAAIDEAMLEKIEDPEERAKARVKEEERVEYIKSYEKGKIIKMFNSGSGLGMYPEACLTHGGEVLQFSSGFIKPIFDKVGIDKDTGEEVKLEKEVVVQGMATRVKEVEGKDALADKRLRHYYTAFHKDNTIAKLWKIMQVKNMTLEVTVLAPKDPKDFETPEALINEIRNEIADIVAPGTEMRTRKEFYAGRDEELKRIDQEIRDTRAEKRAAKKAPAPAA